MIRNIQQQKFLIKYTIVCIVVLLFASCKNYFSINKAESVNVELNNSLKTSSNEISNMIKPYKDSLSLSMDEVLNMSDVPMVIGLPEGRLGNFAADLVFDIGSEYYKGNIDFALLNNGGLRTSLPKGEITRRKVFELMPFENQLVVVTLSREKTLELFKYIAKKSDTLLAVKKGVPVSKNVKLTLKNNKPKEVYINNQRLVKETYKVITSDYLANGGDNMKFFLNPIKTENLGVKLRDAIIEYIVAEKKAGRNIVAKTDKRIEYARK